MPFYVEVTPNPADQPNWFRPVHVEQGPVVYQTLDLAELVAEQIREGGAGIAGYRVRVVPAD